MIPPRINGISIEELFECYDKFDFLYTEKKEKLAPIISLISKNWRHAMGLPWEYFILLTHHAEYTKPVEFASVSAWRSTSQTYNIQHMVSNNAENTRIILSAFLDYMTHYIKRNHSIQVFYQPKTRFANKMFSYLAEQLGPKDSFKLAYAFMAFPFLVKSNPPIEIETKPLLGLNNQERIQFFELIISQRSALYNKLQDLDKPDYQLKNIHRFYAKYGLFRNREVKVFFDKSNGKLLGTLIMSRASLGLNFSLLENSSELLVSDEVMGSDNLDSIVHFMLVRTRLFYKNMKLGFLPLLTTPKLEEVVCRLGGRRLRRYDYFLCTEQVYGIWKKYLADELNSVRLRQKTKFN